LVAMMPTCAIAGIFVAVSDFRRRARSCRMQGQVVRGSVLPGCHANCGGELRGCALN
jgi:hypothetical protein